MDAQKQSGSSSSSSFTSDLFGAKESSGSSVFSSIFSQSPKGWKRDYVCSEVDGKRHDYSSAEGQSWSSKPDAAQDGVPHGNDGKNPGVTSKETTNFYHEQRVQQPCHLSSSIYYGGQDIYTHPQSTQSSAYTTFNNDVGEDDSGSASRGNWWQGSLYY